MKIYTLVLIASLLVYHDQVYSKSVNTELKQARNLANMDYSQKILESEKDLLDSAKGKAERLDENLVLKLKIGNRKLKNKKECRSEKTETECVRYVFMAYSTEINSFVVAELSYEGRGYLLINAENGVSVYLKDFPIFSPSGQNFIVVLANDNEVGFGLQIWKRKNSKYSLEWEGGRIMMECILRIKLTNGSITKRSIYLWTMTM